MAQKADALVQSMLGNRWNATHSPASVTTVPATAVATSPATANQSRPHLEFLSYSLQNYTGAGAANVTITMKVRHVTGTSVPTVVAQVNHLLGFSTVQNVVMAGLAIAGKRGGRLEATMSTAMGSLTQSVSTAGWIEDSNG